MSERPIEPYSVFLVRLDPATGFEMKKSRPCAVISPEVMHRLVRTVIIAPLSSVIRELPMRAPCRFQGRPGEIALDQLRAVDRSRLLKMLGRLSDADIAATKKHLSELFA